MAEGGPPDGRGEAPRSALRSGQRFGDRFEIRSLLGCGGMGVVYRARDLISGRDVALKVVTRALSAAGRERLRREGEVTAALRHPGIIRIHSAGEVGGVPFLAYELIEGARPLNAVLPKLSRPQRVALLRDVARALGAAHAHGVIHRDVKSENILVDADGHPHLADFGLAWSEGLAALTRTGALVGTPLAMAPEQLTGERQAIGPATDVWALGVLLFQALTGEHPFPADSLFELRAKACAGEPPSPRRYDASISADLEAVCLKSLETNPADRYPNADAFADDLENVLAERPVSASASGWRRVRSAWKQRWPWALAATSCLLVAGLALGLHGVDRARSERLRELLAHADQVPLAELRAAAEREEGSLGARLHLALSARRELGWEPRVRAAERAEQLDPELAAAARKARGDALADGGRWPEASEAYAEAIRSGASDELLRVRARALLAAGAAGAAVDALRARLRSVPGDSEAAALLVEALGVLGDRDALRALPEESAQHLSAPDAVALRARVRAALGEDPLPALVDAGRRFPAAAALPLTAVWFLAHLRRAPRPALRVLESWPSPATAHPAVLRRRRWLEAVCRIPPDLTVLEAAPPDARETAAACLLALGERELAFWERSCLPWMIAPPGAVGPDERRGRAVHALEACRRLTARPALRGRAALGLARIAAVVGSGGFGDAVAAPSLPPLEELLASAREDLGAEHPGVRTALAEEAAAQGRWDKAWDLLTELTPRAARGWRLRGEAALRAGHANEARRSLRAALAAQPLDARTCALLAQALRAGGAPERAAEFEERARRLRRERHAEARAAMNALGGMEARRARPVAVLVEQLRGVLALDPIWSEARADYGKALFVAGRIREGFFELADVVHRDPSYLHSLLAALDRQFRALRMLVGEDALRRMSEQLSLDPRDPQGRRLLAYQRAFRLDVEGAGGEVARGALELLDRVLRDDPADVVAYALRGLAHIRLGHWARAACDLEVAAEAAPDCKPVVFYQALLAAGRGDGPERVAALLERCWKDAYEEYLDVGWDPRRHPEFGDLFEHPLLRPFLLDPGARAEGR
ncbi:MAG: serine/threonine-protein kinase [Planctomycetota bacterium]|nr:MAG: serine/threonine-protein kinase [Planctomycetota bacterium]